MKTIIKLKITFFIVSILLLSSCKYKKLQELVYLPIQEIVLAPTSIDFNSTETFKINFILPNGCYSFYGINYVYDGPIRIVSIQTIKDLEETCTNQAVEVPISFSFTATQRQDYVFKFWKGLDGNGEDVFETITVPVN